MVAPSRPPNAVENRLLASLPSEEFDRICHRLDIVSLALGETLCEASERQRHVYFPTTCIISLTYTTESGATAEMGLVGKDGLVGIAVFMGGETMPNRAVVQLAGSALRMQAKAAQDEFKRVGVFNRVLLRYTQALITQISQTSVCNSLHLLNQRLARWLLLTLDRVSTNELLVTQESISNILGVRREGITLAASRLQSAGLIKYSRGRIIVLDRQGLENAACECYEVVKSECDRLLGS